METHQDFTGDEHCKCITAPKHIHKTEKATVCFSYLVVTSRDDVDDRREHKWRVSGRSKHHSVDFERQLFVKPNGKQGGRERAKWKYTSETVKKRCKK